MKKFLLFCLSVLLCTLVYAQTSEIPPVNPNATPEAEKLLSRLYKSVEEGKIISGLHHNQLMMPNYVYDLERIKEASSKTPMIWGGDLAWDARQVVEIATREYNKGRIVTLMWHVNRPFDRTARVDFKHQTQGEFTQSQWDELVTEGSEMHGMWLEQVDSISNYLKILKDRNIPVLWRPYHEMNGEWFWWGDRRGENGFKKLWRMLYERMVDYHHLDNLIWVWNANAPRVIPNDTAMAYDLYYPGHQYVDVLATDVYHNDWPVATPLLLGQIRAQRDEVRQNGDDVNDVHDVFEEEGLAGTSKAANHKLERKPHDAHCLHDEEGVVEDRVP